MSAQPTGPLAGLTVIDCTRALAGPFGAGLLADLGADVIKVESPGGDGYRNIPPFLPDHAPPYEDRQAGTDFGAPFAAVNRNKRSVCLDLKNETHKAAFLSLCEHADALLENMRAGCHGQARPGLRSDRRAQPENRLCLRARFRRSAHRRSPYAAWPCLDAAAQSFGGLVHANDGLVTPALADIFPGTLMALGVVSALHHAQRSGRGQFLDVACTTRSWHFRRARWRSSGSPANPILPVFSAR